MLVPYARAALSRIYPVDATNGGSEPVTPEASTPLPSSRRTGAR